MMVSRIQPDVEMSRVGYEMRRRQLPWPCTT